MERSRPLRIFFAVLAAFTLVATACGGNDSGGGGGGGDSQDKGLVFGMVLQNFTNPAIKDMADASVAEAAVIGNVEVIAQDSNTVEEQVAKAETLIAQGVDVLALQPWSGEALLPTMQKAKDAGIPVFLTQDDAPGAVDQGLAVSYIASDEVEGGRLVGQWLIEALGGSGKVAILEGHPGDTPAVARSQGFLEAIKGSGLDVVAQQTANWARDEGLNVATDILTANPDLDAIFAHNDEMAFGAVEALRAAGLLGDVIVVGYNGTCIGLEATIKGDFQSEGILFLDTIGREFVRQAVRSLDGETVEPRIVPPILVLDSEGMQSALDGSGAVDEYEGLLDRLKVAAAGDC